MDDNNERVPTPEEWVNDHADYLFHYALKRLRDVDIAEDMVQDTFVAAFKSKSGFEQKSSLRTWLTGILKHKIMDHFRRSSRSPVDFNLDDGIETGFFNSSGHWKQPPVKWSISPDQGVFEADLRTVLNGCLSDLPAILRNVFVLRELDEMDTEEIGAELDISQSNIYTCLHRARFKLRACVEAKWFGKGTAI